MCYLLNRRQDLSRRQKGQGAERADSGTLRTYISTIYYYLATIFILNGKMAEWLWRVTQASCLIDQSQLVFSWGNPRGFESPSCQINFFGFLFIYRRRAPGNKLVLVMLRR